MSKVIADITMSLDGYVAPAGANSRQGVGDVDELQNWVMASARRAMPSTSSTNG